VTEKSVAGTRVWDDEADVIVAGAGGAGLSAAIELRDAEASVIVFEKQSTIEDTSTYLCGGGYAFAGTDFQERKGLKDSNDLLYKDLMDVGQWKNDEKMVRVYVDNQLDTYYWLTKLGVKWIAIEALAGMSVPRVHITDPADALTVLKEAAVQKGARLLFKTRLTELLTDKDKRVIGVIAEGKNGNIRVRARKGVILTTGGFGRDVERLKTIDPLLLHAVPVVGAGHTGDGHQMAEALGAFYRDVEYVKPTFGIYADSTSSDSLSLMFYNGAIIVNKEGKRFIDESKSYKDIGKTALRQTDGVGYQIYDQKIYQIGVEKAKGLRPEKALWGLDESRISRLVKADTIEELASKISVPLEALKGTVERYNSGVDAGREPDFGRTAIAGATGRIMKIDVPPFYAYACKSLLPGTYGGIVVDESMNVLNRKGKIPGLYAAGEIVGGFHGASYHSGSAVVKAVIFGRIAARNAAKEG